MPTLDFRLRFADDVAAGRKPCTIRRGHRFRVGQIAYCWTGVRSRQPRFLRASEVVQVTSVLINPTLKRIYVDGSKAALSPSGLIDLSRKDGFSDPSDFWQFFRSWNVAAFHGQLIEWDPRTTYPSKDGRHPAIDTCKFRHAQFCTGEDLRLVHPAQDGLPRTFYPFKVHWCAGCRELMNGAFKYPPKVTFQ